MSSNPNEPFSVTIADDLETIWNLYYRVSEPIFSLGTEQLAEQIDWFFVRAHRLAELIKAMEQRALVESARDWRTPRETHIATLQEMSQEAGRLLEEMKNA